MEKKQSEALVIDKFHDLVFAAIQGENIVSYRGNGDFRFHGHQGLLWHTIVTAPLHGKFDSINNSEDLITLSDELQFIVGELFIYRIHIRDSTQHPAQMSGPVFYPKEVNIAEIRFNALVNHAAQTCYNFWDRIGDLINPFLTIPLKDRDVDFRRAIAAVSQQYRTLNYDWLKNYCDTEYSDLNQLRKKIVHHENPSTSEMMEHLKVIHDYDAIKRLYTKKLELADYFNSKAKEQIEGLFYCFSFLDDVNKINNVPEHALRYQLKQ